MIRLGNNGQVKAVMFDMGNVLVDLNVERSINAFRRDAGFDTIGQYLDPCHQRGFFGRFENGLIEVDEFYAECLIRSNASATHETIDECIHQMLDGIDAAKAELLLRLKEYCDLYLLTNNNPIVMKYCSRLFADSGIPLESTFRRLFYSYQMKMMKPDPAFYRRCIQLSECLPEEIVFVDDSQVNVEAASALGIDARLYVQHSDLSEVLKPCWEPVSES